jgi:hypothetical protein
MHSGQSEPNGAAWRNSGTIGQMSVSGYSPFLNTLIRLVMANLIITYWRDIPWQVAVKLGRKEEKRMLDNRFMKPSTWPLCAAAH